MEKSETNYNSVCFFPIKFKDFSGFLMTVWGILFRFI